MNHEDAVKSMATERYTLDEMEPAERDAFEEHFFECSICADDVVDSAKVAAGVRDPVDRRELQLDQTVVPMPRRSNWWAVAASVFAVGFSYQSLWLVPHLRAAQAQVITVAPLAEAIPLESASRAAAEKIVRIVRRDEAIPLTFPIETNEPQPLYVCEVHDDAGKTRASFTVTRAEANEQVRRVLMPHTLPSGDYKLVIRGGEREIAAYPFTVEVR
jgi:hypothetical protein